MVHLDGVHQIDLSIVIFTNTKMWSKKKKKQNKEQKQEQQQEQEKISVTGVHTIED